MTSTNPYAPWDWNFYLHLAQIYGFIFHHIHGAYGDDFNKNRPVDQALTFSQQIVAGDSWGQAGGTGTVGVLEVGVRVCWG